MSEKRNMDIGELYRSTFKSYEVAPSAGSFASLSESLRIRRRRIRRTRVAAGSGAAIAVAALLIAFWPSSTEPANDSLPEQTIGQLSPQESAAAAQDLAESTSSGNNSTPPDVSGSIAESSDLPTPEAQNTTAQEAAENHITERHGDGTSSQGQVVVVEASPEPVIPPTVQKTGQEEQGSEKAEAYIYVSSDTLICLGQSVRLEAEGAVSYEWSTGSTAAFIDVSPEQTSVYRLKVIDANNLSQVFNITVSVKDCAELIMPNAFTPNYDNHNDVFKPVGKEVQDFRMQIFARNGQLVFETTDFYQGWNGEVDGQIASPGVFVYVLTYTNRLGESVAKRGSVTLIP